VGSGLGLHHLRRSTTARLGVGRGRQRPRLPGRPPRSSKPSPPEPDEEFHPATFTKAAGTLYLDSIRGGIHRRLVAALVEDLDRPLYHGGGHVGRCDFDSGDLTAGCFGSVPVDHPCSLVHIETDLVYFDTGRGYQILNDTLLGQRPLEGNRASARSTTSANARLAIATARMAWWIRPGPKSGPGDRESTSFASQQAGGRNAHIIEKDLGVPVLILIAKNRQVSDDADAEPRTADGITSADGSAFPITMKNWHRASATLVTQNLCPFNS
jgi:hypothetical protein